MPDAAEGNPPGRGVGPSPSGRGGGLRPRWASVSVLGKWALSQACAAHPRLCRLVLGSGDPGQDPPGVEAGVLGLSRACAATQTKVAPGGTPRVSPAAVRPGSPCLGPPRTHPPRPAAPPAPEAAGRLSARKKALCIKYIYIYIFTCQRSVPSGKGQRTLRTAQGWGDSLHCRGWSLAAGVARPLRSGRQKRVSLRRGSQRPAMPGPRGQRS